jgi:hypothetical protein
MGKRGQKPVDLRSLALWEFEFYKAFHLLRDGIQLPSPPALPVPADRFKEIRVAIAELKRMTPEKYWLATRKLGLELGQKANLRKPPTRVEREWADSERLQEIAHLERSLISRRIQAEAARREIWNRLIDADTTESIRTACEQWVQLLQVRAAWMGCFAQHVLTHAEKFLRMKRNKRFPRSTYADESRLEFLARGMAGVIVGRSPMTAIEKLRNMKHDSRGPLWDKENGYCNCWRCSGRRWRAATEKTSEWYENGLKEFLSVARKTQVPKDWQMRHGRK